jgi:hypothetical protein
MQSKGTAAGELHQRGGAGATREGDHQHRQRLIGGAVVLDEAIGAIEQLTVADRTGGTAMAMPVGGKSSDGPAELLGSGGDALISATGSAMEQLMDGTGIAAEQQGGAHLIEGPGEITTTTGNDHPGSSWSHCQCRRWMHRTGGKEGGKTRGENLPPAMGSGPLALVLL